jgi:hypothetical protein
MSRWEPIGQAWLIGCASEVGHQEGASDDQNQRSPRFERMDPGNHVLLLVWLTAGASSALVGREPLRASGRAVQRPQPLQEGRPLLGACPGEEGAERFAPGVPGILLLLTSIKTRL